MIFIGKTTSRPTQHGYLQVLQSLKHIVPVTVRIGNGRILAHPQPAVNTRSEVFGKLAVDFFGNGLFGLVGKQSDL